MKTATDILIKAKQLLIDYGWTQGRFARNEYNEGVSSDSTEATCFCIVGAISRALITSNQDRNEIPGYIFNILSMATGNEHISTWNDKKERTKEEVLAAFDKAIELSKMEK